MGNVKSAMLIQQEWSAITVKMFQPNSQDSVAKLMCHSCLFCTIYLLLLVEVACNVTANSLIAHPSGFSGLCALGKYLQMAKTCQIP